MKFKVKAPEAGCRSVQPVKLTLGIGQMIFEAPIDLCKITSRGKVQGTPTSHCRGLRRTCPNSELGNTEQGIDPSFSAELRERAEGARRWPRGAREKGEEDHIKEFYKRHSPF